MLQSCPRRAISITPTITGSTYQDVIVEFTRCSSLVSFIWQRSWVPSPFIISARVTVNLNNLILAKSVNLLGSEN